MRNGVFGLISFHAVKQQNGSGFCFKSSNFGGRGQMGLPSSNAKLQDFQAPLGPPGRTCAHPCLGKLQTGRSKPRQGSTWISHWVSSLSSQQPFPMTRLPVTCLGSSPPSLSSLLCPPWGSPCSVRICVASRPNLKTLETKTLCPDDLQRLGGELAKLHRRRFVF